MSDSWYEAKLSAARAGHRSHVTVSLHGIYQTACCGADRPFSRGEKFPHCPTCFNDDATWTLVKATE